MSERKRKKKGKKDSECVSELSRVGEKRDRHKRDKERVQVLTDRERRLTETKERWTTLNNKQGY